MFRKLVKYGAIASFVSFVALFVFVLIAFAWPKNSALSCSGGYAEIQNDQSQPLQWTGYVKIDGVLQPDYSVNGTVNPGQWARTDWVPHAAFTGGNVEVRTIIFRPDGVTEWDSSFKIRDLRNCGPQLNLSHIECVNPQANGNAVEVHFRLIGLDASVPVGDFVDFLSNGVWYQAPKGNYTGNGWHYTVWLPDGNYDIEAATVLVDGVPISLHNPNEYAGDYNCLPDASVTVTPDVCTYNGQVSGTDVAVVISGDASVNFTGPNNYNETLTASDTLQHLPPGVYNWVATAGAGSQLIGQSSGSFTLIDCSPTPASVTVTPDVCTYNGQVPGTDVVVVINGDASVNFTGPNNYNETLTASDTLQHLPPGVYNWVATAGAGSQIIGQSSGTFTLIDCTPNPATVDVTPDVCTYNGQVSGTDVAVVISGDASVNFTGPNNYNETLTASDTLQHLPPGVYNWVATAGAGSQIIGQSSGAFTLADCSPTPASVTVTPDVCTYNGQVPGTDVDIVINGDASVNVTGPNNYDETRTASDTLLHLPPGVYNWVATAGAGSQIIGQSSGTFTLIDCTPNPATVSVTPDVCTYNGQVPGTDVFVVLNGDVSANFTGPNNYNVTLTVSDVLSHLPPGNYAWTATAGAGSQIIGQSSGVFTLSDCTPKDASVNVDLSGVCEYSNGVSTTKVPVNITGKLTWTLLGPGNLQIDLTQSDVLVLSPGAYTWTAVADPGYQIVGPNAGGFNIGTCDPKDPPPEGGMCYDIYADITWETNGWNTILTVNFEGYGKGPGDWRIVNMAKGKQIVAQGVDTSTDVVKQAKGSFTEKWDNRGDIFMQYQLQFLSFAGEWIPQKGCNFQPEILCPTCGPWQHETYTDFQMVFFSENECRDWLTAAPTDENGLPCLLDVFVFIRGFKPVYVLYQDVCMAPETRETWAGTEYIHNFAFTWLKDGRDFSLWSDSDCTQRLRDDGSDVRDYISCSLSVGWADISADGVAMFHTSHTLWDWQYFFYIEEIADDYDHAYEMALELYNNGTLQLDVSKLQSLNPSTTANLSFGEMVGALWLSLISLFV